MSTAGTKGVPRPEREQQILDVAVAEIGRVGYAGLSLAEVAARAGVSKPLVYTYFQSKDGLYIACVERAATVLYDAIEVAITGPGGLSKAERTLDAIFAALQPRPHDWTVLFDRSHPDDGPVADASRAARRRIAAQAARGVADAIAAVDITDPTDLSALTDVWMGAVTSLVLWWLRHPEQTAAEMAARSHRLLGALRAAR
ncbi:TetR/AcrR family transcriptional regulator [Nocardia sp. AG03]|uniref:TetR/AcrR family transcriptional regulator n=1 Tax=Nocardia sp. AG03 TaxID=3025312 RepID=UPI0024187568|nr:TetR/AcrR family transcriptional regulator [Nocardia sp. AG03]